MCKCTGNCVAGVCDDLKPAAIDWNKPLQIKNVPSLILISVCVHPNNKLLRIVTAISKDSNGAGFTYTVCSETGVHNNKDYNITNSPTPKKKIKVVTVLLASGVVHTRTEENIKANQCTYMTAKILKTEEFEYEV